jgi:hypothetical protein
MTNITIDISLLTKIDFFFKHYFTFTKFYACTTKSVESNISFYHICKNGYLWKSVGTYSHINMNVYRYNEKKYEISNYSGYVNLIKYYIHSVNNLDGKFEISLLIKNGKLIGYDVVSLPLKNYNMKLLMEDLNF